MDNFSRARHGGGACCYNRRHSEPGVFQAIPNGKYRVKQGDWNDYEIQAEGSRIRTWINGKLSVDLDDPERARRGIFALHIHSGGPTEVRFRNIELKPLTHATDRSDSEVSKLVD